VKGSVHVAHDITERKKKEIELKKLNSALKALGRSSQAMLHAKNEAGYLDEICRIIVEDCGFTMVWIGFAEHDAGKTVRPVAYAGFEEGYLSTLEITWADSERGRGPTGNAIRSGKPYICRNMHIDPAFTPWRAEALRRGYAASIVLPLIADGIAIGAINIYSKEPDSFSSAEAELLSELASDLSHGITTLRMRAALESATETLHDERNFSNTVIQTTGGLIVGLDPDGRIRIFNRACERATGYTLEEVQGKPFWDLLLVPEEREQVKDVFNEILKGVVTAETEFESYWVAKDGERRFIKWANSALRDEHGVVTLVLSTGIDITERQMIEEQIRHKAFELTVANQELEAFSYSVSHDLRNPLHSMIGCIEVLKDYSPKLDKNFGIAVDHIERSSWRMSDIISDLLLLSRVTRQEVRREPVDIGALADSLMLDQKPESPQRNVRFECVSGITIHADPGLVRILLENLIRNAWKFTSKKESAVIEFGASEKNGSFVFFVSDNGVGFDMSQADKLFKPFVRLHSDQEFKGSGIGLAIVKRIVNKHGGEVWAEGEKDKGAAVYFRLE
jgi:PAS domain S-box-containing protein